MPTRHALRLAVSAFSALLFAACSSTSRAASFSSVVVYGDSLSDNGNLYHAVGYPPPPYYAGRFSDGPVAVEQLAAQLNAPLRDYAYGGATAGVGNITDGGTQTTLGVLSLPGLQAQLAGTLGLAPAPGTADPNALYFVWGGANDFEIGGSPTLAAASIASIVATLEADGAQHILVSNLPDLSLTPEFFGNAAASAYTSAFNAALQASHTGNAIYFDTYSVFNQVNADPAAYGFTNITVPCITGVVSCSSSLFFDQIHPTTAADAILARQFAAAVAPTPEPSAIVLLGSGLAGLAGLARKRRIA